MYEHMFEQVFAHYFYPLIVIVYYNL